MVPIEPVPIKKKPWCPTCGTEMQERKVVIYDVDGIRYVKGFICISGEHNIEAGRPIGLLVERTLLNGS